MGWQRQPARLSVQEVLEAAAARLAGGALPACVAAGRTDAGVHAEGQVVGLTLPRDLDPARLREALTFHARPHPVVVRAAARVAPDWSARFSARARAYRYRVLDRRARPALTLGRVWHHPAPLDAVRMHAAAQGLLGRHDFSAFRAAACQADSPVRTLDRLDVAREGEEVVARVGARSFLHHQVRNLMGTLVQVGAGRRPVDWPRAVLDGRDRAAAGQTAPPEGLCLVAVAYDPAPDWR